MLKSFARKAIALILVLAMFSEVSAPLAYAAGNSPHSGTSGPEGVSIERLYDPDKQLKGESADISLDETTAGIVNNISKGDVLEASNDTVLFENTAKRDVNAKGYRLTDGSDSVFLYPVSVHERDINGNWTEINNLLEKAETQDGETFYGAENLSASAMLYETPYSGRFLTLKTTFGKINWGLLADISETAAEYSEPILEKGYEVLQIKSISGMLSYKDVLPGTDINYQLLGHNVEEAIVLNSAEAAEAFGEEGIQYKLSLEGYRAELKENEVQIIAENAVEPEYVISAPYMEDALYEESGRIKLTLKECEDGYIVTICPDMEWLLSEGRAFPVVIDPTFTQYSDVANLDTCTVYSSDPYDNLYSYGNLMVGREASYYQKLRAFIKFYIPSSITSADIIFDAALRLTQRGFEPTNSAYSVWVDAYKNIDLYYANYVSWALLDGSFDTSRVIDNRGTRPATNGATCTFDITATVKDWSFNGNNYGITLMSQNETGGYRYVKYYSAHFTGVSQSLLPTVILTSINQDGIESYLSYHSAGSSSMGTISVGDASGNLIYAFDDLTLSGEYIPLSIQHVYDHAKRTDADLAGTAMHYGLGFRLNLSQQIVPTAISDCPYKYIDADGTSHYFKLKSGTSGAVGSEYEKEFETTTTLTKTSAGYTLDFSGDLIYYFNTSGQLTSITDTSNNKTMSLTYSNDRLTSVTDGASRTAQLSYNSSGYLTQITDPAGRTTSYTYSNNRLSAITEPDGSVIGFTYTTGSDGSYMLTRVTDIDSSYISIVYQTNTPYRVYSITEYGSSGGEGGRLTWSYSGSETTITDRNGLTQTMLFDRIGHTVSVRDGAGNAYFGSYKNTDANNKHSLSLSSDLQGTINNYLVNHNFEQSSVVPWAAYSSSGTGSVSLGTAKHYLGSKSLLITSTSSAGEYGISQEVSVEPAPGDDVTFSAWVDISSITPGSSGNAGLVLEMSYKDPGGTWVTSRSAPLKTTTSGWKRIAHSITVPGNAQTDIRARVLLVSATGTVYVDCAQLETGSVANRYNLLENGYFKEASGATSVSYWSGESLSSSTDLITAGRIGRGFTIKGNTDYAKGLVQSVPVSGSIGDSYAYGAWAKAAAIGPKDKDTGALRDFGVLIRFIRSDNSYETVKTTFDAYTTGWQYIAGTAVAPCDYVSIQIVLCYYYQKNYAVFDDIQLHREGFGTVYTYDSAGRVLTATDSLGRKTSYTYQWDNRPEVSTISYHDGTQKTFTYDPSTHNLLSETDANGVTAYYSYDQSWNNIKVYLTTGYTYLNSGIKEFSVSGYATKETDPFGNETQYSYNTSKGLLTSITEPNSSVTSYSYNSNNDLITGVAKGSSSVSYSYTNRRLTGLSHSGNGTVNYSLLYDEFGNRTNVKVGTQSLSASTYAPYNGVLTQTTYGNGTYTEPVYDSLLRQTGLKINGTQKYRWHYGADGRIGMEEDLDNDVVWRYLYDGEGNISFASGSNGDLYSNSYNSSGKLEETSIVSNGTTIRNAFTYNDETGYLDESDYLDGNDTIGWTKYGLDVYERSKTIMVNSNYLLIYKDIWYKKASDGTSETMVPEHVYQTAYILDSDTWFYDDYLYSYDSMGNISGIQTSLDGYVYTDLVSYSYDSLNQLIRENNAQANRTYVYSYDTGGNIQSVTEYAYTTGALGTPLSTKTYTYGDSNWKDKLTCYNGSTITYDAIGNPLSYRNGMSFTWQDGRRLASATNNGTTTTYTYNSSGIRTSKTVGGTTTEYTLSGTQVVMESTGNTKVLYYYDAYGTPVAFRVKDGNTVADYYYYNNIQGDVIGIVDAYANKVVEYAYDAWGNVISISGSLASTIGQSNPYRYRGYWFDNETGLYYLQSRFYDPVTKRFINADSQISIGDALGANLFVFCANNSVNRNDNTGEAWWHWVLGAAVVVACAVATVVTCGGLAAAAMTVASVASGVAGTSVAATISAGALIGSSLLYAGAVIDAAVNSKTSQEFYDKGDWKVVADTTVGAVGGGVYGYCLAASQQPDPQESKRGTQNPKVMAAIERGKAEHQQMDYGPGVVKEYTISSGNRVDGIDVTNHIIYELKPNNPQAINRGLMQLERYKSAAEEVFGGEWITILKLYD